MEETWSHEVDFVVVGSGGGGMAAALTAADSGLDTLIVEKAAVFGGTTGISGGGIWIPNNPALRRAGHDDSRESIRTYLNTLTEGKVSQARIDAFIDNGPAAMELLEKSKWVDFFWVKGYADYHPELEGGRALGRSIEAKPFDTRKLGEDEQRLHPNGMAGPLGLWVTAKDYHDLAMVKRTWRGRWMSVVAAWRVSSNVIRRRHMATTGRALVSRLRLALKDAGVPVWLETPMSDLVVEDGVVTGVVVERDGVPTRIRARKGVLLATGGFDHNDEMRKQHLPEGGKDDISGGARSNTGDGILAGERLGADTDFMDDAWWMPSVKHPAGAIVPLVSERSIPPSVIVSARTGERFTNEAAPYVNFVHDQLDGGHIPVWFVMDAKARSRYPFARVLPGVDFPAPWYDAGTVVKDDTIAGLAGKIGVPADKLTATVERFNGFARSGKDADFGRGDSAYDRYYGDPTLPNPAIDTLDRGPYYAVKVEAGDLGTKGGLVSDEHARVLRADGSVIEGLYATGNTSASVMANEYPGAGGTIGPSIVFGYVAARHAVRTPAHVADAQR
ncbi:MULTISPECIES: FAD-binding protein [unclassified Nocardioides]|uniref:FAD-binding protein n=1 Tax=unclassified Nocardioides TaxID=2615069 RepID=UPI0007002C44|nr:MULTISPECIES: FAD-binding protein [unclassified Nocardioides]KQY54299.1 3-ketosteroid-delta-1-dehydrogenase [Nocardioides sp. Root140]KQZ74922.1 3-ketosteroid-delta-1-dehydrogenase [Nocardioides sp. Root151]